MELSTFERKELKKSQNKRLLCEGSIPAVMYSAGKNNQNIFIKRDEFSAHLRKIKKGGLSTVVFQLVLNKKKYPAIVKQIQYDKISYAVIHVDFELLEADRTITIKIPIQCEGVAECAGVKLGGVYRQSIRFLRVRCQPKKIPTEFVIDVKNLNIGDVRRLSDITLPEGVIALDSLQEIAVTVAKKQQQA